MSPEGRGLCLFGGTFDPPHRSHVRLARSAREQLPVDEVLIVPCGEHPLKEVEGARAEQRLAMCRLAFDSLPDVRIDTREIEREGPSFSVDTVTTLHREHPGRPLFWLIGADNLDSLHRWHRVAEFLSLVTLAVFPRTGHPCDPERIATLPLEPAVRDALRWRALTGVEDAVSATAIRAAVARGASTPELQSAVRRFIDARGLYHPRNQG